MLTKMLTGRSKNGDGREHDNRVVMYSKTEMVTMLTEMVTGGFPEVEGPCSRMLTDVPVSEPMMLTGYTHYICV